MSRIYPIDRELLTQILKQKYRLPTAYLAKLLDENTKTREEISCLFFDQDSTRTGSYEGKTILVSIRPEDVILPDEQALYNEPWPIPGQENIVLVYARNPLTGIVFVYNDAGQKTGRALLFFNVPFKTIKVDKIKGNFSLEMLTAIWPGATVGRYTISIPQKIINKTDVFDRIIYFNLHKDTPMWPGTILFRGPICMECGEETLTDGGFTCFMCGARRNHKII